MFLCNGIRYGSDVVDLLNAGLDWWDSRPEDRNKNFKRGDAALKTSNTFFAGLELLGKYKGYSNANLLKIKVCELPGRIIDIAHKIETSKEPIERSLTASCSSLGRTIFEAQIYENQSNIDAYFCSSEWQKKIKEAEAKLTVTAIVEAVTRFNIKSLTDLINRIRNNPPVPPVPAAPVPVAAPAALLGDPLEGPPVDPFDLVARLNHIPKKLHNDVTFRKYLCAIKHVPIRDPVRDPTLHDITLYERSVIIRALALDPRSPITGHPLQADQLLEAPEVKNEIDEQLEFYSERMGDFLDNEVLRINIEEKDQMDDRD